MPQHRSALSRPLFGRMSGLLSGLLFLAGCAGMPADRGLSSVSEIVAARGEVRPVWSVNATDELETRNRVQALLAGGLDAEEAAEVALLQSAALRAGLEEVGISHADLVSASRPANPLASFFARFPDGSTGARGTNLGLDLTQSLLGLLALPSRTAAAEARVRAATLRAADEALLLAAETRAALYAVQAAKSVAAMRGLAAQAAGQAAELSRRLHAAGNLSALRLTLDEAEYEELLAEAGRAQADLAEARADASRLMGLGETAWDVSGPLPGLPANDPAAEGLVLLALDNRLDLASARALADAGGREHGLAVDWRFLDDLAVGASAEKETDGRWVVGPSLEIAIPLFDQGQGRVAEAEGRLRRQIWEVRALAADAAAEVRGLSARLAARRGVAERLRDRVVPLREKAVAEWQKHYNFMLAGYAELLAAKRAEYRAYEDYVTAVRDWWILLAQLRRASGGRLPGDAPRAEPLRLPDGAAPTKPPADAPAPDHGHGAHAH